MIDLFYFYLLTSANYITIILLTARAGEFELFSVLPVGRFSRQIGLVLETVMLAGKFYVSTGG